MTHPNSSSIYSLVDLGMPEEPNLSPLTYADIRHELRLLGQVPRAYNLVLDCDTIPVYDRISESAGEIGDIVGRGFVTLRHRNLFIPERREYGDLTEPGLDLDDEAATESMAEPSPGIDDEEAVARRLLGYMSFRKIGEEAEFSGSLVVIDHQEVELEVACMLGPNASDRLNEETRKFAESVGLGALWRYFTLRQPNKTHINTPVGQFTGEAIAESLRRLQLSARA